MFHGMMIRVESMIREYQALKDKLHLQSPFQSLAELRYSLWEACGGRSRTQRDAPPNPHATETAAYAAALREGGSVAAAAAAAARRAPPAYGSTPAAGGWPPPAYGAAPPAPYAAPMPPPPMGGPPSYQQQQGHYAAIAPPPLVPTLPRPPPPPPSSTGSYGVPSTMQMGGGPPVMGMMAPTPIQPYQSAPVAAAAAPVTGE